MLDFRPSSTMQAQEQELFQLDLPPMTTHLRRLESFRCTGIFVKHTVRGVVTWYVLQETNTFVGDFLQFVRAKQALLLETAALTEANELLFPTV